MRYREQAHRMVDFDDLYSVILADVCFFCYVLLSGIDYKLSLLCCEIPTKTF